MAREPSILDLALYYNEKLLIRRKNLVHASTTDSASALGSRTARLDFNLIYIFHLPLFFALHAITYYLFVHINGLNL